MLNDISAKQSTIKGVNAFIAMQVERIPTLTDLSYKLKTNQILRYCCGFEVFGKIPSPATLSRFLTKLSMTISLENEFHNIIKKAIHFFYLCYATM